MNTVHKKVIKKKKKRGLVVYSFFSFNFTRVFSMQIPFSSLPQDQLTVPAK